MDIADLSILATYAFQIILVCFYPVPSAGSTVEMLFKTGKDSKLLLNHPANSAIQSVPKTIVIITATITVIITASLPLITMIFPPTADYLFLLIKGQPNFLTVISTIMIIGGNILTCVGVRTLRSHVTFHEFGETRRLHTAGIYHIIRNPITVGLAAIFIGFFLALPSVVMLLGVIVFLLNSAYRVGMEEIYLERTFGQEYVRYNHRVGKYFPNISNARKR